MQAHKGSATGATVRLRTRACGPNSAGRSRAIACGPMCAGLVECSCAGRLTHVGLGVWVRLERKQCGCARIYRRARARASLKQDAVGPQ